MGVAGESSVGTSDGFGLGIKRLDGCAEGHLLHLLDSKLALEFPDSKLCVVGGGGCGCQFGAGEDEVGPVRG